MPSLETLSIHAHNPFSIIITDAPRLRTFEISGVHNIGVDLVEHVHVIPWKNLTEITIIQPIVTLRGFRELFALSPNLRVFWISYDDLELDRYLPLEEQDFSPMVVPDLHTFTVDSRTNLDAFLKMWTLPSLRRAQLSIIYGGWSVSKLVARSGCPLEFLSVPRSYIHPKFLNVLNSGIPTLSEITKTPYSQPSQFLIPLTTA
ncbi:hypothetical protein PLICRDRAFT_693066 [Plicaturopsis crispa FD-325 SS-3]|nr:hypothetical protein PLICRDRAFT_693066 [Plicaturopsis crispa FD-325 SS-3]